MLLFSRNALLKAEDRRKATCIYRSLLEAKDAVSNANVLKSEPLLCGIRSAIEGAGAGVLRFTFFFHNNPICLMIRHFFWIAAQGGVIDYAKAVSKYDLTPRDHIQKGETLLAIAVFFDKVRLIDNIEL